MTVDILHEKVAKVYDQLATVIRGKEEIFRLLFIAIFAEGHILMEDVPGVGKTTLAKALAKSINAEFNRIQFTPDMLPADISGTTVYSQKEGVFSFRKGPVFANLLLADEINRALPRTQSALLEAMNERQVSIDGETYPLPDPFLVIATENPIEYYGTFPLPEAQLDRFAIRLSLGYPDEKAELALLLDRKHSDPLNTIEPVLTCPELRQIMDQVRQIGMDDSIASFALQIITATRNAPEFILGGSPRALLTLMRCAQAAAWLDRRDFVKPDDILQLIHPVLAHRMVLSLDSKHAGIKAENVLTELLKKIKVPV